jgi:hypothetical protein
MILDALLAFDTGSLITASGTTQDSANIIDLGNLGLPTTSATILGVGQARDIGIGDDPALKLLVQVITAASTGTSMTVTLEGAIDTAAGVPSTFSVWWVSPAYTTAQLVVGARLMDMDMPRPPAGVAVPRFLKLVYTTVSTCNPTIAAYIVLDRHDQMYQSTKNAVLGGYPAGITVAN